MKKLLVAVSAAVCVLGGGFGKTARAACTITLQEPANGGTAPDTRSATWPFKSHSGDLSIPKPTTLSWSVSGDCAGAVYDVYLGENSTLTAADKVGTNVSAVSLQVWNLKINTRYYWKVAAKEAGQPVGESPVFSFTTFNGWPRMIKIDGCSNGRDIGGQTNAEGVMVKQGLLFRTSEYNDHFTITAAGIERLRRLGVIFEIDTRSNGIAALPADITYFKKGISGYWTGIQDGKTAYRDIFRELAKPANYPLTVHCWGGMDRTGTVCAMLEALLGYSDDQILLDYQWSSLSIYGARGKVGAAHWEDWVALRDGLEALDTENGTFRQGTIIYLKSIGITDAEIASIRNIFLGSDTLPPVDTVVQVPYGGTPHALPGTIQAEDFDTGGEGVAYHDETAENQGGVYRVSEGVDIEAMSGGGYMLGFVKEGEWTEYTVDVAVAGSYDISLRAANAGDGGKMHIAFDGVNKTGTVPVPNTGSWTAFQTATVTGVSLDAGTQVMRVSFDQASDAGGAGVVNFDYMTIAESGTTSLEPVTGGNVPAGMQESGGAPLYDIRGERVMNTGTAPTGIYLRESGGTLMKIYLVK